MMCEKDESLEPAASAHVTIKSEKEEICGGG